MWDVEVAKATRLLSSTKVSNCLRYSTMNSLLASGDFDGKIRLYDTRREDGSVVKLVLSSHKATCSSVAWSPSNEHQVRCGCSRCSPYAPTHARTHARTRTHLLPNRSASLFPPTRWKRS